MSADRHCMDCGTSITACFGFVLARDIVRAFDGEITRDQIRERCSRCTERIALGLAAHPPLTDDEISSFTRTP